MAKKGHRFVKISEDSSFSGSRTVYVDRETRVQYLHTNIGSGLQVTVLVDREGRPLVYNGTLEE